MRKYGNVENLMLKGSDKDLALWSGLSHQTGLGEKEIISELSKDADNWESILKGQTANKMQRFTDQLLDTASDSELGALNLWTGETYANINRYTRFGINVDEISRNAAHNIENILNRLETTEDLVVKRGSGTKHIFEKMPAGWKEDPSLLVGHTFTDKGFTATSPFEKGGFGGTGENHAELFIYVPKGTHGAYIESVAHNEQEREFLLQKGYEYSIVKAEYRPSRWNPDEYDLKVWVRLIK